MAKLTLFSTKYSAFGLRAEIALQEKKIPYDLILMDELNKPQGLLDANPIHKKFPTIIHDGKPVAESLVILEYLEDVWPEKSPLLPKDAYARSKVRFWVDYVNNHAFGTFLAALHNKPGSPERQAIIDGSGKIFKTLEDGISSFSAEGPFFTGDTFGMVDVVLAPLAAMGVTLEKIGGLVIPGPKELPRLNKYLESIKAYPSVSASLPTPEQHYNELSTLFKRKAAEAAVRAAKPKELELKL